MGRFLSADTVVPDPKNPQSLNRFSYGLGNPVKYRDPSGHCPIDAAQSDPKCLELADQVSTKYRVNIDVYDSFWETPQLQELLDTLSLFKDTIGEKAYEKYFSNSYTQIHLVEDFAGAWQDNTAILPLAKLKEGSDIFKFTVAHELFHGLAYRSGEKDLKYSFAQAANWRYEEPEYFVFALGPMKFNLFQTKPGRWNNPQTGPTDYAKQIQVPLEDAMETAAALMVPGSAQYPVTSGRESWFRNWIAELNR